MSAAQLCRLEKTPNMPSIRTLQRVAEALEVTITDLMEGPREKGMEMPREMTSERRSAKRSPKKNSRDKDVLLEGVPQVLNWACEDDSDLCYDLGFLSWEDRFPSLLEIRKESMVKLSEADLMRMQEKMCEYREMEQKAGVPVVPTLPLLYPAEVVTDDPEGLSKAMRVAGGIAEAVLFDTVAFFESKGIRVIPMDLPEGVESFTLWDEEAQNPVIFLRKQSTEEEQQFSMVSEVGWCARYVAGGGRRLEETPATRRFVRLFAAAFLMPEPALREIAYHLAVTPKTWTLGLALQVKQRFGVSLEALLFRLESVGLLQASVRARMGSEKEARYGAKEPFPAQRSLVRHSRFSDLRIRAREG